MWAYFWFSTPFCWPVCLSLYQGYTALVTVLCVCSVTWSCLTLCNSCTVALQTSLSMGFLRKESWSGWPFPTPGDLPWQGWNPHLRISRHILYHWANWETLLCYTVSLILKINQTVKFTHKQTKEEKSYIHRYWFRENTDKFSTFMIKNFQKTRNRGAFPQHLQKRYNQHT